MGEDISYWVCPSRSCNNKRIKIERNTGEENYIRAGTYRWFILHFLQHLREDHRYIFTEEIYSTFRHFFTDILNTYDYKNIGTESSVDIRWQNFIRSVLNNLRSRGYLLSRSKGEIPDDYFRGVTDGRKEKVRERSDRFFREFQCFDDWEVSSNEWINLENLDETPEPSGEIDGSREISVDEIEKEEENVYKGPKILIFLKENMNIKN